MKFLIFSIYLVVLSTSLIAQPVAVAENSPEGQLGLKTTVEEPAIAAIVLAHNKMAHTQVTDHLKEHLGYPEEMIQFALDGTVVVAIVLSPTGNIARVTIAKSDLPEAFHQELFTSLIALEKLDLKGGQFMGDGVLYVPVHFNM